MNALHHAMGFLALAVFAAAGFTACWSTASTLYACRRRIGEVLRVLFPQATPGAPLPPCLSSRVAVGADARPTLEPSRDS